MVMKPEGGEFDRLGQGFLKRLYLTFEGKTWVVDYRSLRQRTVAERRYWLWKKENMRNSEGASVSQENLFIFRWD